MARRVFSVVVALIAAFAIIATFESAGGALFKTPVLDPRNPKTVSDMMATMPLAAFIWLLAGYASASFVGGVVATFFSGGNNVQPAMILGAALTVGSVMNLIQIPGHPVWFMVANVLMCIPLAWVGYLVARKKKTEDAAKPASETKA